MASTPKQETKQLNEKYWFTSWLGDDEKLPLFFLRRIWFLLLDPT